MTSLFIVAGEQSGDLLAASIVKKLPKSYSFEGIGGQHLQEAGTKLLYTLKDFAIMGFVDVLKALPRILKRMKAITAHILDQNPDGVLLVDYPDFNLRLAKRLKAAGYRGKIIQLVSPSIWAWRKGRLKTMEKCLDHLLVIYPFEEKLYKESTLNTTYIGNPIKELVAQITPNPNWREEAGIPKDKELLAFFPGSRKKEVELNLPAAIETCRHLSQTNPNLALAISVANEDVFPLIENEKEAYLVPHRYRYDLMQEASAAIAKCGTVTLELGLLKVPSVVIYQTSAINRFLALYVFRLKTPFLSLANIIPGKQIFKELIYNSFEPSELEQAVRPLLEETDERKACLAGCEVLESLLKENNASEQGANQIKVILECVG